ncbi:MAG: ribonuclease R [Bdellovibrionales bacterium]|nr:ribonuclease R [Bdellovibrionales bacterium]
MKLDRIIGVAKRHPDGFGFLIPDDSELPDLYIARNEMRGVMTNDRVEVSLEKEKGGNRYFGTDLKVLERGVRRVVGKVKKQPNGDLVLYDGFQRWGVPLAIPFKNSRGAVEGDLVAVDIVEYPSKGQGFTGRVVEIIGDAGDANSDLKKVLHMNEIPIDFAGAAMNEARTISQQVTEKDIAGRKDLRDLTFITIDGVTAKDFDDAIYVEQISQGFRLWVAIADVSHYVRPGTYLDDNAFERGTSVYLPNYVVPMLPEELSNGICSLKPKVDRLAFVCEMDLGFDGVVSQSQVYEAVIQSKARVTYGEAQEILNEEQDHEIKAVEQNIKLAADLAKILMAKRFREGSLDLEVPETEVVVNELGEPVDVIKNERLFAHRLIEEMMLVANISVAKLIQSKEQPALYRVHEPPKAEDVAKIQQFLKTFGSDKKLSGGHLQKKLSRCLQDFTGKPEGVVLNILTLRSMSQARYVMDNVGHFGLGFQDYTHFTSPIRRYPDLVVHRILKKLFTSSSSGYLYSEDDLTTFGTVLSACEQRAVKAERQVISIKKARFLKEKVGEFFPGVISSVAKFGVFVLLRQYDIDGLVKVENLGDDFFEFDEEKLLLKGKRSGQTFRLGDVVRVQVAAVNTDEGQIDFLLTKEGSDELVTGSKTDRRDNKKRGKTKKDSQRRGKVRVSRRRPKS